MKNASAATLAIISAGNAVKAELWDIVLSTGQAYHFSDFPILLNAVTLYMPLGATLGPYNYSPGLIIKRDSLAQKAGLDPGSCKVMFAPQLDSPSAPITLAGYPFLQACRYGFLDGATFRLSKLFMNLPAYTNNQYDTSPGAVGWFQGTAQEVEVDRLKATITVSDYLAFMSTQQMPKNVWSPGCGHTVYSSGCGLLASAFTVSGTIATAGDSAHFTTNLTQADHYFDLGVMTFNGNVTAALIGVSIGVAQFLHTSGAIVARFPAPTMPAAGDTFTIYPGCDLQQATCSSKFNNLAHFMGEPYVPVPETMIDGGTDNPPLQTAGAQAGQIVGSQPSGRSLVAPYKT